MSPPMRCEVQNPLKKWARRRKRLRHVGQTLSSANSELTPIFSRKCEGHDIVADGRAAADAMAACHSHQILFAVRTLEGHRCGARAGGEVSLPQFFAVGDVERAGLPDRGFRP